MKNLLFLFLLLSSVSFAQEDKELYNNYEEETKKESFPSEIGIDAQFSGGSLGGVAGGGLKFGIQPIENLIVGPSVRLQHTWYKNQGITGSYNVYGGGVFLHYRMFDYLFVGTEIEILHNPITYLNLGNQSKWVPTALLGGGFSHSFNDNSFRLNAGIMYDVLNRPNSPFRQGYVLKKENGTLIPVLYRIALFIPI